MLQRVSNWMTTDAIKCFLKVVHFTVRKVKAKLWAGSLLWQRWKSSQNDMNIAAVCLVWFDMFMQKTQWFKTVYLKAAERHTITLSSKGKQSVVLNCSFPEIFSVSEYDIVFWLPALCWKFILGGHILLSTSCLCLFSRPCLIGSSLRVYGSLWC